LVTTLTNKPLLANLTVTPEIAGFGVTRQFNVTVFDANNTVNITLWRASSAVSPVWVEMGSAIYGDIGGLQNISFNQHVATLQKSISQLIT